MEGLRAELANGARTIGVGKPLAAGPTARASGDELIAHAQAIQLGNVLADALQQLILCIRLQACDFFLKLFDTRCSIAAIVLGHSSAFLFVFSLDAANFQVSGCERMT